jgi:hypothetical protein
MSENADKEINNGAPDGTSGQGIATLYARITDP